MKASEEVERLVRKLNDGSLHPDEPLFVLRARDQVASQTVVIWSILAHLIKAPYEMVEDARDAAILLSEWPVKQVPGRPETRTGEEPPNADEDPDAD